jgi:phenylacetate-CoA ligase
MIGTTIRSAIFWSLDYLSGSPVRRHLHNIQLVSKNGSLLVEHQAQQLKLLLNHAVQTTDYFKNYDRSGMLKVFPVINKNIIRESFAQFQSSVFKGKKLNVMETTGSTGTPFRVVQNSNKHNRVQAEVIHSLSLIGYQVGTRYAWTIAEGSLHREKRIGLFSKNKVELCQYVLDFDSAERHLKTLLNDQRIEIIIGYSSVLFDLARHILTQGTSSASFGVKGVLCCSEPLYPQMREAIRKAFNCPVLSRYSNEECGVLAYECPTCRQFHLNTASYFFETLDLDRDEPTAPGTPGRIVVTDLYNYALPMIRYDTGDIGAIIPSSCTQFSTPILQSLEGRRGDALYDTSGRRVMMFSFDFIFEKLGRLGKVKQFQLIQEGRDTYRLRICANDPLSDEIGSDVITRLKAILGADAQVDIEYANEIPVLNSGKRRYIVSNYKPDDHNIPLSSIPR